MRPALTGWWCVGFSHEDVRGLMEAREEEVTEEGIHYVAMRNLFVREAREAVDVKVETKTRSTHIRESAERMELSKTVNPSHLSLNLEQTGLTRSLARSPQMLVYFTCMTTWPRFFRYRWRSGRSSVRR